MADLRVGAAVDLLPGGVRLHHADAVRAADVGRPGHRVAGGELRLPQGGVPHAGPAQLRCRLRDLLGPGALLLRRRRRCHRLRSGPVRRQGGRPVGQLGQPHLHPRRGARGLPHRLPRGLLPGPRRRPALRRVDGRLLPAPGDRGRRRRRPGGGRRDLRAVQRRGVPLRRAHLTSPPPGDPVRRLRPGRPGAGHPRHPARCAPRRRGRGRGCPPGVGGGAVGLPAPRVADRLRGGRAVGHHHRRAGRHRHSPRS